MSVAFRSQVAVAYESTATIEWSGDLEIGFIQQNFVNAIDFTFAVNATNFLVTANKLAKEFEAILTEFSGLKAKAIDFTNEARAIDYTVEADLIKTSQEIT